MENKLRQMDSAIKKNVALVKAENERDYGSDICDFKSDFESKINASKYMESA